LLGVVDAVEGLWEFCFQLVMAVLGIVIGFGEGVVGIVVGLYKLVVGVGRAIEALVIDVFAGDLSFRRSGEFWRNFGNMLWNLPTALAAQWEAWKNEFERASFERQTAMIGEITGQILALIAGFAVGGAGTAGDVAATAGRAGEVVATAGRSTQLTLVARGTSATTRATTGVVRNVSRGRSASGSAFEGSAARSLPAVEVPPARPPLALVPAPAPAPAPVLAPGAATATSPASGVSTGTGVAAAVGTATSIATVPQQPTKQKGVEVVLRLPAHKSGPDQVGRYRTYLGALVHDPNYVRRVNAQARRWDSGIRRGMRREVVADAQRLGFSPTAVTRPNWTRLNPPPITAMQVDHIIELQLIPGGLQRTWGDQFDNYELLDQRANGSSGSAIQHNVWQERVRLRNLTGNPLWTVCMLRFDRIETTPGDWQGVRWSPSEIEFGEHVRAWRRHHGLPPPTY
jgi:hypothetical protein